MKPAIEHSRSQRSVRRIGSALLIFLLSTVPVLGWGKDGHRIVARIAAGLLTERARTQVAALLEGESMADVSTWADAVREETAYRHTAPWHYVNIPRDAEDYAEERDCPREGCVVTAIRDQMELLKDAGAPKPKRVEALKFLIHFVGDLHQPLHAGLREDRGGNDISVDFLGRRRNLHEVWDTEIIEESHRPWEEMAKDLATKLTPEQRESWRSVDPAAWATESHKLALSHAYAVGEDRRIEAAYVDRCRPIVEDRLMAAGVRLAAVLNGLLDPQDADGGAKEAKPKP